MQSPVALAFLNDIQEAVQLAIRYWAEDEHRYSSATAGLAQRVAGLLERQDLENSDMTALQQQIHEIQALLSEELHALIDATEPLNGRQRMLLHFCQRQLRSMLDPENTVLVNPGLSAQAVESQGQILIDASSNYLQDLANSRFGLQIKRASAPENILGEEIATTPGSVVFQNELIQLIHYKATTSKQREIPLLITPPCINRFYIFDLRPEESMVRWLLDQGQDVYMISWVNPGVGLSDKDFSDYVYQGCLQSADVAAEISGVQQVNLAGYCIGGLIAAVAASTEAGRERIASLSLFATLLDYSNPGELGIFTSPTMLDAICAQTVEKGVLSADILSTAFTFMREEQLFWRFFRLRYLHGQQPAPDALMYWGQDATNLPARMAVEYLRGFYGANQLAETGTVVLGQEKASPANCNCPQYIMVGESDHIVPMKSAMISADLLGGNARIVQSAGGHVRGVFNHPESQRGYYRVPGERDVTPGSWWTDWLAWLEQLSGSLVEGKICAPAQYKAVEPAPGSYVRIRS
jgi:polyhydroxyalkanoate synthase